MVKTRNLFVFTIFIFTLTILASCSDDAPSSPQEPSNPPVTFTYFKSVGNTKQYTSKELIAELMGYESSGSLPSTFPDTDILIEEINYYTNDPQGNTVTASGIISYPVSTELIRSTVMAEHYTISANYEAPSLQMSALESVLALYEYMVIIPDFLGFGTTKELRHPYLHVENTAQVSIDMLFAVREYMESKNAPLSKDIYITGYSQGGAAALATQKMAEEKYTSDISIKRVIAGGGPYDLTAMFDNFAKTNDASYPCSLPLTIIGLDYGDNLNLDYSKVFIEPLLSNYDAWINSKQYNMSELNHKLGSNMISSFMHADFFTETTNSELKKIYTSLDKNSLINWAPKSSILLVHGKKDDVVPFFCTKNAYDSFKAKGANVELIETDSGHKETAITYYIYLLKEMI